MGWVATFSAAALLLSACAPLEPHAVSTAVVGPDPRAAIAVYATADDLPLRDVLVYLRPLDAPVLAPPPAPAALDLMHRHFEPRVLAVPVGSAVSIHNLDDVDHELYSFSPTLPFSLHLAAKGGSGALTAAHAGVAVLGCKVHDEMVGYLYVTDAPYFGKTDSDGYLRLAGLKPGRYTLGVWRAPGTDEAHARTLTLAAGTEEAVRLRF